MDAAGTTLPRQSLCVTCLSRDRKLFPVNDCKPHSSLFNLCEGDQLCWECNFFVLKLAAFRSRAARAQALLAGALQDPTTVTNIKSLSRLAISPTYVEVSVKPELIIKIDAIKEECEITFEECPEDTSNNDNECYNRPFKETGDEIWIPVPNQLTEAGHDGVCGEAVGDDAEANLKLLNRKNFLDETQKFPSKILGHHVDGTPEYSHIHPEDPTCSKNLEQLFKPTSGLVKLELIPMDNQLTSNCPMTFNSNLNNRHVNQQGQQATSDAGQTQMDGESYVCNTYKEQFCSASDLIKHIKKHTDEKPFSCDTCGKAFSQESALLTHLQRHINGEQYIPAAIEQQSCLLKLKQSSLRCDICGKQFSYQSKLKRHILIHTGEKPFPCGMCDKQFNQKAALIKHSRIHLSKTQFSSPLAEPGKPEEKSVRCDTCGKQFSCQSKLHRHIHIHMGEDEKLSCDMCNKKFTKKTVLISHIRKHMSGDKFARNKSSPLCCEVCGKQFFRKAALAAHCLRHTGEKPFSCETCHKQFRERCGLKRHIQMKHTNVKPFCCDICQSRFKTRTHLVDHVRTHTGEKPFGCDVCPARFSRKQHLVLHMRTHTGERPYGCGVCPARFANKWNLTCHSRIHTGKK